MKTKKALTALLLFALMRGITSAETAILFPVKDNTLYLDLNGQVSNGQGIYFFAGMTLANSLRRGLVAFDLTSIPANATITGATLSMSSNRPSPNPTPVNISISKVLRDWGEGASDAGEPGGFGIQAEPNDATWTHTFWDTSNPCSSNCWTTPGGDFSPTLSATTAVMDNATYHWSGSGLLADVQAWFSNPATNFGWVILGNEEVTQSAQRFNSGENPNDPPKLTVTYQVPGSTPSPAPTVTPSPSPTPTSTPTPTPSSTPAPSPSSTPSPTSAPSPLPSPSSAPSPNPTPSPTPAAQAVNLSTRMRVETGENVGIGGFIISGTAPKHVLVRAIGPSLAQFGVPNALTDPVLELRGSAPFAPIINDNWRDDPVQEVAIMATGLAPTDDLESAIDATLSPGAYTAVVRGKNNITGVALIEVYDLSQAVLAKLANISTRAFVNTGDNIVIAGFVLGNNSGADRIVVRGIGPSLIAFGVANALANPTLELRNSNGALLVMNNDWQDNPAQAAELTAAGLAPTNPLESGIAATLPPGLYTALLAGLNNGTGVGVVEAYDRGAP